MRLGARLCLGRKPLLEPGWKRLPLPSALGPSEESPQACKAQDRAGAPAPPQWSQAGEFLLILHKPHRAEMLRPICFSVCPATTQSRLQPTLLFITCFSHTAGGRSESGPWSNPCLWEDQELGTHFNKAHLSVLGPKV